MTRNVWYPELQSVPYRGCNGNSMLPPPAGPLQPDRWVHCCACKKYQSAHQTCQSKCNFAISALIVIFQGLKRWKDMMNASVLTHQLLRCQQTKGYTTIKNHLTGPITKESCVSFYCESATSFAMSAIVYRSSHLKSNSWVLFPPQCINWTTGCLFHLPQRGGRVAMRRGTCRHLVLPVLLNKLSYALMRHCPCRKWQFTQSKIYILGFYHLRQAISMQVKGHWHVTITGARWQWLLCVNWVNGWIISARIK